MRANGLALSGLALALVASPAVAERPGDKGWLQVGAFYPKVDSNMFIEDEDLTVDSTPIDLERDLGLDDRKIVPKIEAGLRIGKRFRVEADYFRLNRSADKTLDRTIVVDDNVFPVSLNVESKLKTSIYRLAAGYSFIRNEKAELGVALGAHVGSVDTRITATELVTGDSQFRSEERDYAAPLPNVGLFGSYALSDMFSLEGRFDAFKIKFGDYKGKLFDAHIGISARVHRNIGLGLAYRHASYEVDVDKESWNGEFKFKFNGPAAYLELVF